MIRNARPDGLLVAVEPFIGKHTAEVFEFAATTRCPGATIVESRPAAVD